MPKKHESLPSLILTGSPGDWYHDLPEKGDRSVETLILRHTEIIEDGPDEGATRAHFEQIRTRHHGRAELYGYPEYQYRTTQTAHSAETEEGSPFIRHIFSMGGQVRAVGPRIEAKRYSRPKLLEIHQRGLEALGYDLP